MKRSNHIDRHVGYVARKRRHELGLDQADIAERVGCSRQSVTKYESGQLCMSAGLLYRMSQALEVGPEYFFAGMLN